MRKVLSITAIVTLAMIALTGCKQEQIKQGATNSAEQIVPEGKAASGNDPSTDNPETGNEGLESAVLEKITAEKAKEMMDQDKDIVILDVRTEEEYLSGHIQDAILIPDYEIADKAEDILTDKDAVILVYCRSGRRSAIAAEALSNLGYNTIYDFGGILDWPYEITEE